MQDLFEFEATENSERISEEEDWCNAVLSYKVGLFGALKIAILTLALQFLLKQCLRR